MLFVEAGGGRGHYEDVKLPEVLQLHELFFFFFKPTLDLDKTH